MSSRVRWRPRIVIWGLLAVGVAVFLVWLLLLLLGFSPSTVVISKSLPATSFPIIKFREEMESATLLAESLSQPGGNDRGGFRVELTHLVSPVVVLGVCQVGIAAFSLASWGVDRTRFNHPGTAIKPAHEVILGRGKISPPTQIQPNSTGGSKIGPSNHRLALGYNHETG